MAGGADSREVVRMVSQDMKMECQIGERELLMFLDPGYLYTYVLYLLASEPVAGNVNPLHQHLPTFLPT
jgi:hypothetical protein